jgi:hypothetical protein
MLTDRAQVGGNERKGLRLMSVAFDIQHLQLVGDEPKVCDRDLAKALGISLDLMRYRIGKREKNFASLGTPTWTKSTNRYGRPAVDIYLSLPVAAYLCDDFNTPTSDETKKALRRVFEEYARGLEAIRKHLDRMK